MKYNEAQNEHRPQPRSKEPVMEYDSVEESLRDALRHGVRNGARPREEASAQQEQNTFTKRHNYITVYEHDQQRVKPRSLPNQSEDHRTHPVQSQSSHVNAHSTHSGSQNGNPSLGVEDFRKYCMFLTERMQKMEEQNDQLVRLAEQQKHEYNKVASQIAQSEMMQRRLHSECINLRRQVQQLTSCNQKLNDSTPLHGHNVQSQGEAPMEKVPSGHAIASRESSVPGSMPNLHSSTNQHFSEALMAQFGASIDEVSRRDLTRIKSEEMATIIELYNALQRHTGSSPRSQPSPPEISGDPVVPVQEPHPLGVIHEQSPNQSDYATPSSVCATQSCTCCDSRASGAGSKPSSGGKRECKSASPGRDSSKKLSHSRVAKLNKSTRSSERSQSFDNNAYIEVELKNYEKPAADPVETQDAPKVNFRRDTRLRRSHNHYMNVTPKRSEPQRPSSLVLDLDAVQIAMEDQMSPQSQPGVVALSPVSPYENHVLPQELNQNISNIRKVSPRADVGVTQKPPMSPTSPLRSPISPMRSPMSPTSSQSRLSSVDGKIWCPRTSSASSSHSNTEQRLTSADSGHMTSPGSPSSLGGNRKSFSKLEFGADLPPPPPPPPQSGDDVSGKEQTSSGLAPRTSVQQRGNSDTVNEDVKKHTKSAFSQIRPRKLSVWKQSHQGASPDGPGSATGPQKGSGWRRKSYAAACRKSQSLDHLYEQILIENGREKKVDEHKNVEKTESGKATFSTLQPQRKSLTSVAVHTLPEVLPAQRSHEIPTETAIDDEEVFDDALPPPPPPHVLQEVMSQDGQSTGYAVMVPVDYDAIKANENEKTQQNAKTALERTSSSNHYPPQRSSSASKISLTRRKSSERSPPPQKSKPPASSGGQDRSRIVVPSTKVSSFDSDSSKLPKSRTCDVINRDYDEIDDGLRKRRMSEGSAGRRKKEILETSVDDGKSQLRRRRSVSSDFALNRRKDSARHYPVNHVIAPHERTQSVDQVTSQISDVTPQPRFPSTNPHMRTTSATTNSQVLAQKSPQTSPEISRSVRTESLESGSSLSQCSQSTERRSLLNLSASKSKGIKLGSNPAKKAENSKIQQRGRSASKTDVSSKKSKDAAPGGKKSGGGSQSRSLKDLMKSKFGRSVSGGRSNSSSSKKTEQSNNTKNPDPLPESQLKPASSFIDPRTLSLEPNSYLPPGKDGLSTGSKKRLALGGGSDAAVGRKLSQPYPNGSSTSSPHQQALSKLVEEVVSDEGFAEGSTIERPDKEQIPEPEVAESRRFEETSFPDAAVPRKSEMRGKKDNREWYESVVSVEQSDDTKAKRFQILSTEDLSANTPESRFLRNGSAKHQQQHTRVKVIEEPPYENLPIDSRHIMPHQINTFLDSELNNNEKRLSVASGSHPRKNGEVFAAGVTIVRTPQPQGIPPSSTSPPTRPKPTRQLHKTPKTSPGSAIGRIMKSASRISGSKEDLSPKTESSIPGNTAGKSRKPDKDAIGKKINYSDHQKVFEKAFISSVVEAELTQQRTSGRSTPQGSTSNDKSTDSTGRTPASITSSGADSVMNGSVGTGSSFGSLPSDGMVDVTEFQGTTSSSGSLEPVPSKPNQQRMSKSKRNSSSGFGFSGRGGLTGTNESSSSSSSTEMTSYRGRSKTASSSGLRSPAVSLPPPSAVAQGQARSSSCATGRSRADDSKPPDYQNSISKLPAYSDTPQPTKPTINNIKSIQSRRSHSGSRISRLSTPSKLSPPGKTSTRSHSTSSQDGSPAASKPQSPKLKLAPLNYGVPPNRSRAATQGNTPNRDHQEPVYENSNFIAHQNPQSKFTPPPNSQIPSFASSLRQPTATSSSVPTTRPPSGCASSQLESRRSKRTIPSAVGLHRPRPVNLGVGAS
uniref:Uncharacterized protein LOC100179876 n=1 Tax=Phallusia mammillata TaxID=59560 RepID=A0A6F9DI03_9ASCI|nr:uncharacterized protein LOC100179876 [Phallusia mammillata]